MTAWLWFISAVFMFNVMTQALRARGWDPGYSRRAHALMSVEVAIFATITALFAVGVF